MRNVVVFLVGIAVVALGLFGSRKYADWQNAKLVKWRTDSTRVADDTRAATLAAMKADTIYLRAKGDYVVYRDRILGSGTATPRDSATFQACNLVQQTCDERHAADSVEKASLRAELVVARARPTERPPRVTLYGEGLYDLLNAAPVFRAGAELRLLGEIRATAVGDVAVPSAVECRAGRCGVTTRALVGVRYVF